MNRNILQLRRHMLQAALLLGFLLASQTALAADSSRIYTSLTGAQLLQIMQDEGYSASLDKDGDIRWKLQGCNCLILFFDDNASIQFYYAVTGTDVTLERINAWNAGKRYSRTYLDEENDPCLELDLDLTGGISGARIVDFLRTCKQSLDKWEKEVIS